MRHTFIRYLPSPAKGRQVLYPYDWEEGLLITQPPAEKKGLPERHNDEPGVRFRAFSSSSIFFWLGSDITFKGNTGVDSFNKTKNKKKLHLQNR